METTHRTIICVDLDWGSSGVWIYNKERKSWANWHYEALALPDWLVSRFNFWTDWHNRKLPGKYRMADEEKEMFNAYQLSLAIDLRRFLDQTQPDEYEVRSGRKRIVEVPEDAKDLTPTELPMTDVHFGTDEEMLAWCEREGIIPRKDENADWDWHAAWDEFMNREEPH